MEALMNGLEWLLRPVGTLALIYWNLAPSQLCLISSKSRCIVRWWRRFVLRRHLYQIILDGKKDATYWLLTQTCMLALEKCQILPFCPFQGHPLHDNGHEQQNHLDIATQPSYQCETLQAQFLWKQARKAPSYARWKQRLTDSQGWSVELLA